MTAASPYIKSLVSDKGITRYQAVCEKCNYEAPDLSDKGTAEALLKRHTDTRNHKVNSASKYRYTV